MFLGWCGKFIFGTAAACAATFVAAPAAQATDASWGCQVLLCAASERPSWHAVPYCVPPMQKLITAMSLPGFSWPICKEGNAGKPGLELYEPCPSGWAPKSSDISSEHGSGSVENLCTRNLGGCNRADLKEAVKAAGKGVETKEINSDSGHSSSCEIIQTQERKRRDKPYFFAIPNSNGVKQRFWFDLDK